ncbi:MAG: aromatic aminobenezylarsenical efflux permease ArsG family transporter [Fibrobacterota bacterium]
MDSLLFDLGMAFWLGVITSISPCPLATNIAAISYVGRRAGNVRGILSAGLLYTLGRTVTYLIVGFIVTKGLLSIPHVSLFLQINMNRILGPLLIIVALVLFGRVDFSIGAGGLSDRIRQRVDKAGIWGALILGILFALTFCPVSAALFFGSLIPLALRHSSTVIVPSLYGIGTAVPVLAFAAVLAISVQAVGRFYAHLTVIEIWIRRGMAVIFLGAGVYMTLAHTLQWL